MPLRRALLQVANETLTRGAIQEAMKGLVPSNAVVSQQVTVGKDAIVIHLISTSRIPDSKVTQVREDLMRRTGHDVQLSVDAVASKSELADLMERLARPAAPVIPKEKSFAEVQQDLLDRVRPAIQGIWPVADAPIQDFNVILDATGATIDVHYQAAKDLGGVPIGMVLKSLQIKLGMPDLKLTAERVTPPNALKSPPKARPKRKKR